ncbi:MAG: M12 family metallopeptidase [Planctomycetota bacterium]|nr:M12 family metallopeptidase [Planctomycetota bacterium]
MTSRRMTFQCLLATGLGVAILILGAPSAAKAYGSPELEDPPVPKSLVPPGYRLVHGDILVPDVEARSGGAPIPWSDGIVYFEFDGNVTSTNRQLMLSAMDEWNYSGADVQFVPRTVGNGSFYVHIQLSDGNNAAIGMQGAGQTINIVSWGSKFIMAHELCHTLGFWHEQSRTDRDTFVDIITSNIESGHEHNFDKEQNWLSQSTSYDFDSVMHYGQFTFTDCLIPTPGLCETIVCRTGYEGWQWFIGQKDHLSSNDIQDMKNEYGSNSIGPRYIDWTVSPSAEDGSLRYPFRSFALAEATAPDNSEFWIRGGTYDELGTTILDKPGTYRVHNGLVRVQ